MSSDSILKQLKLKPNLSEKELDDLINKIVIYFSRLYRLNQREKTLSESECNEILFTAILFESLPKIIRELSLDYATIENNTIKKWKGEYKVSNIIWYDGIKLKGALHFATCYILNTNLGEQFIPLIKMQYKNYSSKANFVTVLKTFTSSTINSFTLNNFIWINKLDTMKYFRANLIIKKIHEDSLDGEFDRIVFVVTKIIRLETDVTLEEIFIIISQIFDDDTEISLHFLNVTINIMSKFDSSEYLKFWESLFEAIDDENFVELFCKCTEITPFYKAILSVIEIYLKKVVINNQNNELIIPDDIDVNFILLSRFSIEEIVKFISVMMSDNCKYYEDFKCRVKMYCTSYDVYRYLKVKLCSLKK